MNPRLLKNPHPRRRIVFLIRTVALLMLLPLLGYGQGQGRENLFGCDEMVARQDVIVSVALESLSENTFLIVVIRPGVGEVSNQLAARRLFNMRQYFKLRGDRIAADKLVLATGAPTQGLGQVEFYIQGRLADVIAYPRNGFICHSCCGPDTDFYPDRGQRKKSRTPHAKKAVFKQKMRSRYFAPIDLHRKLVLLAALKFKT